MENKNTGHKNTFIRKIWTGGLIFALILSLLLLFRETVHIFMLILVGALIACYFRGLGNWIKQKTNWSITWSMVVSVISTFLVIGGLFTLIGSTIVKQTTKLQEDFPRLIQKAEEFFETTDVGKRITLQLEKMKDSDDLANFVSDFFRTSFGGIGDIYVIILVGIYFTASPLIYRQGIIQLVPPRGREKASQLVDQISSGLTKWLFGKFFSMTLVFVLTAIALGITGIPMWLALSFIAGLLVFIPNFGPIIAAIPALLVALSQSVNMAITVGIIYIIIQVSEGSFITPKVQQRLISIPPALIILGQIFGGTLIGAWGVVFATPMVLILMILVKELYIKPMDKKMEEIGKATVPEPNVAEN